MSVTTSELSAAIARLEREGAMFNASRDSVLRGPVAKATLERTNRGLMQVERALTRSQGLRTRPWFRNLIYVADENNGYANLPLPSVNEALRTGDESLTRRELDDLTTRFGQAATALANARAALIGR